MKRVVVTGLGAITPIGNTIEEFREGLQQGKSGAGPITIFDTEQFKTQFACEVKNFNPEDYLDRREVRRMDRFAQYSMVVADQAIQDSGIDFEQYDRTRIGVIFGVGIGGLDTLESEIEDFAARGYKPKYNPFMIPKMIPDIAPGLISMKHKLHGINYATVSACASSAHAIINGYDAIRLGRADAMVVGGAEAAITHAGIGGFNAMKALSANNDEAETASRPFDKRRDGFVLGEGGACMMLETYEGAKARGAKIYGEIIGTGMTADAHHMTAPHPEGIYVQACMEQAMQEAGIDKSEVDYINVHGTSTPLGDIAEIKAIEKVFGEQAYRLNISSTKSMTGHLLGGAGVVEAVACLIGMNHDFVPPTINHEEHDPEIDERLNLTLNEAQQKSYDVAMSNAFGFGGHNTTIIMRKLAE